MKDDLQRLLYNFKLTDEMRLRMTKVMTINPRSSSDSHKYTVFHKFLWDFRGQ
jgi:hypothetical protein